MGLFWFVLLLQPFKIKYKRSENFDQNPNRRQKILREDRMSNEAIDSLSATSFNVDTSTQLNKVLQLHYGVNKPCGHDS